MVSGYDIDDSGVIPCSHTGGLLSASQLILCQQSAEKDLQIGIASILNCLDAAEAMKTGAVSLSCFPALPDD